MLSIFQSILESSKVYELRIGIFIQAHAGSFLPDARGLVASEGCLWSGHPDIVDPDHPALELPGDAPHLGVVLGVEEPGQPSVAVIGGTHGLLLSVEGRDGRDRTEYFLPPAAHVALVNKMSRLSPLLKFSTLVDFRICITY